MPFALLQLRVRPEAFEKFYTRLSAVRFCYHRHDIVPIRFFDQAQHPAIRQRRARNLPPLAQVDIDLWRREVILGAGFDFDKAERRPIVCNDVNLRVHDDVAQVSADRK